uniref:Ig family protein n=1 Tax=Solibacter usitatus (strain Ellin6076) TaxID=234267 RepID=Q02BT6_SOLUE
MRVLRASRLLLLAALTTGSGWGASITSITASYPPPGVPAVPPVTGVTSCDCAADQIVLYIKGSFNANASIVVNWIDPTVLPPNPVSLGVTSVTPTQIVVLVNGTQFQTPVNSPVTVQITVDDQAPITGTGTFTIIPAMISNGPLLGIGTVGQPYNFPAVAFGTAPYQIGSASLPPGLSMQATSGGVALTGTPTQPGVFNFSQTITDFWGNTITAPMTVQIVAPAVLTSLSPPGAAAGSPDLTLTINGSGFEAPNPALQSLGSSVLWKSGPNLVSLTTTFVNGNRLQAAVPAALLTTAGIASITVLQPDDHVSNALPFNILAPAITSLSPARIAALSPQLTLSITGTSFLPGATLTFGGSPLTTTFVNAGSLTAVVPATLLRIAGAFPVVVTNPGGASSAAVNFLVNPVIAGLAPSNIPAGSPQFTLSITGATFVTGALPTVASFNGSNLATTVVNSGLITAVVPAALVTTAGSYPVVVTNPGGNASAAATFTVTASLTIATTSLGGGTAGAFYTGTLQGKGGTPPYTWSASGLPPSLTFNPQTGVIAGIPSQSGTFIVSVTVRDSVGASVSAQLPLVISPPPVSISTGGLPNGTVGVPYIGIIGATGGASPYSFAVAGGKLPDGLSFNSNGTVSGTPTTPGTFTFSVNVTDSAGGSTGRDFSITIAPAPLVVTGPPAGTGGTSGTPITIPFTASGGVGAYRCSTAGTLPPGTAFSNCTLSGTPTTPGSYTFRVTVTDSTGVTAAKDVTLVIAPPALNLGGSVGNGQVGVAYSAQLSATGGVAPYSYSFSGLPDGLSGSAAGAITGTPATAGQFSISGSVVDSTGAKANATFNISIVPADLTITTSSLPDATVNSAYAATLAAAGGIKPYTWSVTGLPEGLSATAAGAISGTPTAAGKFTVSVSVKDAAGTSAGQRFTLTIAPAAITINATVLPSGTVGAAYSATLSATGGVPPFTWSATGLPAGLTISAAGSISGTPTVPGVFAFTATVKDSAGTTASKLNQLTIALPPAPPLNFGGISSTLPPLQQPQLTVSLGTPYPVDVVVTLTLTFAPDSGADDPTIVFSTGGRTARITIPAGSTAGSSSVGVQTGTVAGLITITAQLQASGQDVTPAPAPRSTIRIAALAPVPTGVTATRNSAGFTVTIAGYVTDREVTQAIFTFNAAPGSNLQTTSLTIPADTLFAAYFGGASATPFGGQFTFTQPFTITGNNQSIVSVTVTMVNKIGQSTPVTVNLN